MGSYTGHSGLRAPRRLRSVPLAEHGAARTPDLVPDPPSLQDRLLAEDERRQGVRRRRYGRVIDPRTSAQIIFKVSRRGGKLWISSDSLGLVAGHRIREASSRSWTLTFDSYIPYAGVKPGLNELEFGLEQTKGVRIKSLRFFVDSGIRYSPYSPARITLRARALPRRVRLGHPVRVVATMRNTGDRGIGNALLLATIGAMSSGSGGRIRDGSASRGRAVSELLSPWSRCDRANSSWTLRPGRRCRPVCGRRWLLARPGEATRSRACTSAHGCR